jgi:hypothetical protein
MDRKIGSVAGPKRFAIALLGVMIAQVAIADTCPITECNYLDPQYQTAFAQYRACLDNAAANFEKYMRVLSISNPRFGIAYNAYMGEVTAAVRADGTSDAAAMKVAKQRFDDRILSTAEPEALEWYNLYMEKMRANPEPCGAMPEPPKGQPLPIK